MTEKVLNGKTYDLSKQRERKLYWLEHARSKLKGRRITDVRYITRKEANDQDWIYRCIVLQLDDGSIVFPTADDEGNDAGVLQGQEPGDTSYVIPVLR